MPQTTDETGLPGRPSMQHRRRAGRCISGLPGRMAMPRSRASCRRRSSAVCTRSWSPTEAPPSVTSMSAPAVARLRDRRVERLGRVARRCRGRAARAPALAAIAATAKGVRGDDLVGAGVARPARTSSSPVARIATRGLPPHRAARRGRPAAASDSAARVEPPARLRAACRLPEIEPGAADVPARRDRLAHVDASPSRVGVLLDDDRRRRPSGTGAPVKMRTASPGPTAPAKPAPGGAAPITASRAGHRGDVGGAHGVAVHGRGGEGRLRAQRGDGPRRACGRRASASGTVSAASGARAAEHAARAPRRPEAGSSALMPRLVVAGAAAALFDAAGCPRSPCRGRPPSPCRRSSGRRPTRRSAPPSRRRSGRRPCTSRCDAHAGQRLVERAVDRDLGEQQRMAERDQLVRALRRHDAGDAAPCRARRPSWRRRSRIRRQRFGRHRRRSPRRRRVRARDRLVGDVDHVAPAPVASRWVSLRHAAASARSRAARRVAAATSACRIRLSPTRKVRTPARGEPRDVGVA